MLQLLHPRIGRVIKDFSNTCNTRQVAEHIAGATGGALWEIVAADPYTEEDLDYSNSNCRARQEQDDPDARPEISGIVENFNDYEAVFIGHPIWWGDAPRIIQTFLETESYDFLGKDVYTFSTSASSSGSGAFGDLQREYPSINLIDNLHLTSRDLVNAEALVGAWIAGLMGS